MKGIKSNIWLGYLWILSLLRVSAASAKCYTSCDAKDDNTIDHDESSSICLTTGLGKTSVLEATALKSYSTEENDVVESTSSPEELLEFSGSAITMNFCPSTSAKLEALGLEHGVEMHKLLPYTFRINLKVNLTGIQDNLKEFSDPKEPASASIGVFFRMVFCSVFESPFCNLVVHTTPANEMSLLVVNTETGVQSAIQAIVAEENTMIHSPWMHHEGHFVAAGDEIPEVLSFKDLLLDLVMPENSRITFYRMMLHSMLVVYLEEEVTGDEGNNTRRFWADNMIQNTSVARTDTSTFGMPGLMEVSNEPKILALDEWVQVLIYIMIGIFDIFAFVLLGYLICHRNNQLIKIAQGTFLCAIVIFSVISSTFTFTLMPVKDLYCVLQGPMIQIPFTVVGAILVSRLWRVYVTLSGAMRLGTHSNPLSHRSSKERNRSSRLSLSHEVKGCNFTGALIGTLTALAKFQPFRCRKLRKPSKGQPSVLRKTATAYETWQLVVFLSLPQTILHLVGAAVIQPKLVLETSANGQVGRYFCNSEIEWLTVTAGFLTCANYALAVVLAWLGRDLPSIFNEKDAIFNTAAIVAALVLIAVLVVEMTATPTSSPDAPFFVQSAVTILSLGIVLLNIVFPKVRRAANGEKVVIGKLLRAYGNEPSVSGPEATHSRPTYFASEQIFIHKDDPLPPSIEDQIHNVHKLLGAVVDKSSCGKALSAAQWNKMIRNVAKLKTVLDTIIVDFKDETASDEEEDENEENKEVEEQEEFSQKDNNNMQQQHRVTFTSQTKDDNAEGDT